VVLDLRSLRDGLKAATPYLEAQANVALMIFIGTALFYTRQYKAGVPDDRTPMVLTVVGLVATLVYLVVSLCPSISQFVGGYFDLLQFPYRLTSFINYGLLLAAFGIT
jgi:hypothetical protein